MTSIPTGGNDGAWEGSRFHLQPHAQRQIIDGFGASGAWWAQYVGGMSDSARKEIADLLFSPTAGIGLSQYRYNAGGGIDPDIKDHWRTAECCATNLGKYDWTRDANARWFLQAAKERGVSDFVLFANSAPIYLTRSGHTYNKDGYETNLSPDNYPAFASYLADIVKHFRDYEGIDFNYISPINEPEWEWQKPTQEGSPYTLPQILELARAVIREFQIQGLQVKILAPEAGAWEYIYGRDRCYAAAFAADPLLQQHCILAAHSYWSTDDQREQAGRFLAGYPGFHVWQTEWCEMVGGRDYGMDSALVLARTIHSDLVLAEVSAWQLWLAVSRYDYRDGLIYTNYAKPGDPETIEETKRLWALGNFSRFIRPGSVRIAVQSDFSMQANKNDTDIFLSAYLHKSASQLIVVGINQADGERNLQLSMPALGHKVQFVPYRTSETENLRALEPVNLQTENEPDLLVGKVILPPRSITTFVVDYYD